MSDVKLQDYYPMDSIKDGDGCMKLTDKHRVRFAQHSEYKIRDEDQIFGK